MSRLSSTQAPSQEIVSPSGILFQEPTRLMQVFRCFIGFFALIWFFFSSIVLGLPLILLAILEFTITAKQPCSELYFTLALRLSTWPLWAWGVVDLSGLEHAKKVLNPSQRYLILANHVSWFDIPVIFALMLKHHRLPSVFVLKEVLKYMPVFGQVVWAMRFPMIKGARGKKAASPIALKKQWQQLQHDLKRLIAWQVNVVCFPEGTRYRPRQTSSKRLLPPKLMAVEQLIQAVGPDIQVLDLSLFYQGRESVTPLSILNGTTRVALKYEVRQLPQAISDQALKAPQRRDALKIWLNQCWDEKNDWLLSHASSRITSSSATQGDSQKEMTL